MNQNNKTGQIICYENRTFLFATDSRKSSLGHLPEMATLAMWIIPQQVANLRRPGIRQPCAVREQVA